MPLFSQPSSAARTALIYITIGALMVIWTGIWFIYLRNHPPETTQVYYWGAGILVTGLVLILIGLGIGQIGRAARPAEHPPQVLPPVMVSVDPNVAVVPTATPLPAAAPTLPPNGMAPAPAPPGPR